MTMSIRTFSPFQTNLGDWVENSLRVHSLEEADVVLLPGGADVSPTLYGHTPLSSTHINENADKKEWELINNAVDANKFVVGICKGAQMLTAKAGGWLIQDVTSHQGSHLIETCDGYKYMVNSAHHQMCYPYDLKEGEDYQLLAWADSLSSIYEADSVAENRLRGLENKNLVSFKEPEIIWYPKIRGLGLQMHPEWGSSPDQFNQWVNNQIIDLL